ncbi:MAG: hypothetical protein LBD21_08005 [Tannerellaceae bacterium]|nr:hypothetical protein [Tannerellaceae bacterium]
MENISRRSFLKSGGLLLPEDRFEGYSPPPGTLPRCDKAEAALPGSIALRTQKLPEWEFSL